MNEQSKRSLTLIPILAALALLVLIGGAAVAAPGLQSILTVCPPPGTGCDHTTIQAALDAAGPGDTVRVAHGIYIENLTVTLPITVEGGYSGPPAWTRSLAMYETVVDGSASAMVPGEWDSESIAFPRVISDTDTGQYLMWYQGQSLASPGWGWALGLAESPDGLNWAKYGGNPILEPGEEGAWDSAYRGQVSVLKDGGLYKMWYSGHAGGPWQTGYATSTNGIDWSIYGGNPVLPVGAPGSWDEQEADGIVVIKDGGLYKMWYHGCGDTTCSIGYATSANGLDWTKHAGNPVLAATPGEWDEVYTLWPSVVKDGGTYKMWYYGGGGQIGLATSLNGVNWTKHAGNPILTEGWDGGGAWAQTVILEGGTYKMWLRSGTDATVGIGYAESTDGIAWTMSISNPLLTPGTPPVWAEPVVRFQGGSDGSVLDGLTITGGAGEVAGGVDAGGIGDITIRNCLIRDNQAGGANGWGAGGVLGGSPLTIVDTSIVNNQVVQGASGVRPGEPLIMVNVLLAGNRGDAAIHANGSVSLTNVTVTDNGDGGILFNPESSATLAVLNSIVYRNAYTFNFGDTCPPFGTCQITYSDVEGGWTGTGNIDQDPLFFGPANGNYRLRFQSPCVDAGTAAGAPDHDLDGTPRPQDAGYDMGAYEWAGFRIFLPLLVRSSP